MLQMQSFPLSYLILGQSADSVEVCFTYVIPFPRLIFVKTRDGLGAFRSELDFSVDAFDSSSGINSHIFNTRKITSRNFEETQDRHMVARDLIVADLRKSSFKISAEVRDDNQQITYLSRSIALDLRHPGTSVVLSAIFADSVLGDKIFPSPEGDVAAFPNTIRAVVVMKHEFKDPPTFSLEKPKGQVVAVARSVQPWQGEISPDSSGLTLDLVGDNNRGTHTYIISFPSDTLRAGQYELTCSSDSSGEKLHFSYLWLDEPLTLRDRKTALSLIKYILPDSVFSEINSGSDEEVKQKFDAYWKSHDPTPNTAFNELEDEFYRRADYAVENFRTISNLDGAATDRGKAYIVYGKPAEIKRELRSDGTYETWVYPNMKRALVFKEQRAGDFKLYETEKL